LEITLDVGIWIHLFFVSAVLILGGMILSTVVGFRSGPLFLLQLLWKYGDVVKIVEFNNTEYIYFLLAAGSYLFFLIGFILFGFYIFYVITRSLAWLEIINTKGEHKKLDWLVLLYYYGYQGLSWRDFGRNTRRFRSFTFQRKRDDLGFRIVRKKKNKK
jgi:hypothetical protein